MLSSSGCANGLPSSRHSGLKEDLKAGVGVVVAGACATVVVAAEAAMVEGEAMVEEEAMVEGEAAMTVEETPAGTPVTATGPGGAAAVTGNGSSLVYFQRVAVFLPPPKVQAPLL